MTSRDTQNETKGCKTGKRSLLKIPVKWKPILRM